MKLWSCWFYVRLLVVRRPGALLANCNSCILKVWWRQLATCDAAAAAVLVLLVMLKSAGEAGIGMCFLC